MAKQTITTVLNSLRPTAFDKLCQAFDLAEISYQRIGDSEIAIEIGNAPSGEAVYALFSPEMKPYADRVTSSGKTIKAFDLTEAIASYNETCEKRKVEAEKAKEAKEKKIARDKARREANAKAKEERERIKKEGKDNGMTALDRMIANYTKKKNKGE